MKINRVRLSSWLWLAAIVLAMKASEKWEARKRARETRTDLVLKSTDRRWLKLWRTSVKAEHDA